MVFNFSESDKPGNHPNVSENISRKTRVRSSFGEKMLSQSGTSFDSLS
jgi:hypothetical protein